MQYISLYKDAIFGYNKDGLFFQLDKKIGEKRNAFQLKYSLFQILFKLLRIPYFTIPKQGF